METIDTINARRAYAAACAKLGEPDASSANPSGSLSELHNSRKAVRRLINKLAAQPEADDGEALALAHAANLVERISATINILGGHEDAARTGENVMRTSADFRNHYGPKARPDESFDIADFLRGVAGLKAPAAVRNALSEGTNSAGGYALPSIIMPAILEAMVPASSVLRAGAGMVPIDMGAKSYTWAGVASIPQAAWRLESGTVQQSDPTFRGVVATPHSLSFYFKVSRELLADASNIAPALVTAISQSMAVELDRAALRGTGIAPEPLGILNTTGVGAVTNGANGTSLVNYSNFFSAAQTILNTNAPMPTAAIMNPRSLIKLGGLVDTLG
ncbi:MAG: phage major capsid protein, partial [Burkholderiales bacterium]|nr:phage major capsid protein [Burkholderiales bacterium]